MKVLDEIPMPKNLMRLVFAALICAAAFGQGHAYSVERWSFERQVSKADLVIVGQVGTVGIRDSNPDFDIRLADVAVLSTLKGASAKQVRILYRGAISEDNNPDCCRPDHRYLFVLKRRSDGVYYMVNGPFGVYAIPA